MDTIIKAMKEEEKRRESRGEKNQCKLQEIGLGWEESEMRVKAEKSSQERRRRT